MRLGIGVNGRGRALAGGQVEVADLDLDITSDEDDGHLHRTFLDGAYDACELSLGVSVHACGRGFDLVAVPVFPVRKFRHSFLYVNSGSGIASPKDLEGRRVGINSWSNTAAVWTRAFLAHDYSVDIAAVDWAARSPAEPEISSRLERRGIRVSEAGEGRKLAEQLCAGDLDALVATAPIGDPRARRLFPDYREVEQDYYARTGILPIGHVVAVRRAFCELEPRAPELLREVFEESKKLGRAYDAHPNASDLVWFASYLDEERRLFGDPFAFGLEDNRTALEAFLTYAHEQCLTAERRDLESLFV